jgi:magnesium-transporting ATPase (P-type)
MCAQDLLYTTVLAGTMGFTRPAAKLTPQRPPERLMSAGIWFPVVAQFLTCAVFQVAALAMLAKQPWYVRFDPHPGATGTNCFARGTANSPQCSASWENSAVFIMSLGQFLITALVFNKGPPHRAPLYTNTWLLLGESRRPPRARIPAAVCGLQPAGVRACAADLPPRLTLGLPPAPPRPAAALLSQTLFLLFLVFTPGGPVTETFAGMVAFPSFGFRCQMLGLLGLNLAAAWLADHLSVLVWSAMRGLQVCGMRVI